MNRRKFFTNLAVGLIAAPTIVKALATAPTAPVVTLHVTKKPMTVKSGRWSVEMSEQLESYHGISAENELVEAMSKEISREINKEILERLTRHGY